MQTFRFLVVDDASFIRDLVKRTLRNQFSNCQIDEAINGKKAQSLLAKNRYDLVLCDWEMPEKSGLEVLTWLRSGEQQNNADKTPFMMVTSRGDKSHVVEAVSAGVSDYIGKPFSSDQLLKKVFKLLSVNHKALIRSILKGTAPVAPSSASGFGGDSASLLTASTPKPAQNSASSTPKAGNASLLTAGSVSSKLVDTQQSTKAVKSKGGKASLGNVTLRSPKAEWVGQLRAVSLMGATVVVEFGEYAPPRLLEQMVIDIVANKQPDHIARINTIVTSVALVEKTIDCRTAILSIQVVDDDADKIETLSYFVEQVNA